MFYTYILYSEKFDSYYVGHTENIENRIEKHNNGQVPSTKPFIPWQLIAKYAKETRSESAILERKLKNLNRARLLEFIQKY